MNTTAAGKLVRSAKLISRVDKGGRDYFELMSERLTGDRRPISKRSTGDRRYSKECDMSVPEMPKINFPESVDRDKEYDLKKSLGTEIWSAKSTIVNFFLR